jgi:hypothetical protein
MYRKQTGSPDHTIAKTVTGSEVMDSELLYKNTMKGAELCCRVPVLHVPSEAYKLFTNQDALVESTQGFE